MKEIILRNREKKEEEEKTLLDKCREEVPTMLKSRRGKIGQIEAMKKNWDSSARGALVVMHCH